MKKEIIPFDENGCGSIGYGYTNEKQFFKDLEKITGEKISEEDKESIENTKVIKFKDGYLRDDEGVDSIILTHQ